MWRIALSDLNYDEREERAVLDVLRSRWLSLGPKTEEFEARASAYLGVKHAIAVTNCTCALELAYSAAFERLGEASCVTLVPSITFVASANAARCAGGSVEILDIESLESPLLDSTRTEAFLARLAPASAVVCIVHYGGFDCHSEQFLRLARAHGALLIEDAAHAIGGQSAAGRALGTSGDIGCYSFFSNKNLATGEGGLVVTNDDDLARGIRLARSHGMTTLTYERHRGRKHGYDVVRLGHNYRCTEIMAALALEQLDKLDAGNARRRALFQLYCERLAGAGQLRVPFASSPGAIERSACHIFPLLCESTTLRDRIRADLDAASIQTSHHYPPLEQLSLYRQDAAPQPPEGTLPLDAWPQAGAQGRTSWHFAARQITLPLHPRLEESQVEEICERILASVRRG